MRADPLVPLVGALRDLGRWFRAGRTRGAVIGGVAASWLGRPRFTRDIDAVVVIDEGAWQAFVDSGASFGFLPRRADVIAFARRTRVLLMRHAPSGIDIDVSLGALPFEEEAIVRSRVRRIAGVSARLVSPEDLIIMKAVAHRPRDLADIEGIAAAQSRLDRKRIDLWVREFATALEMPELVDDLERALAAGGALRPKKRRKRAI